MDFMPDLAMAMVCVPHTSISFTLPRRGRAAMADKSASRASEMSERIGDLPPAFKILKRLLLTEALNGKTGVDYHIFAELRRVYEIDAKLTAHTHRLTDGAVAVYIDQFEWDSKTH